MRNVCRYARYGRTEPKSGRGKTRGRYEPMFFSACVSQCLEEKKEDSLEIWKQQLNALRHNGINLK